jgi:hypothetical protein
MQAKPYLAGAREFAELYGVKPLQVSQWIGRGVLDYEHAVVLSGSPYWLLRFARDFGQSAARPRDLYEQVLERLVAEQDPARWIADVSGVPPLVGLQEGKALFGLSNTVVLGQQSRIGRPAQADYYLSGSPLWLLDTLVGQAEGLRAQARTLAWEVDPRVEAALRAGRYDGPGSVIKPRGRVGNAPSS